MSRTRTERSAGGVVLRAVDDEVHVLVIRDPYLNWGLPKGHIEMGEEAEEAALREVREETGLERIRLGREVTTIDWYFRVNGHLVHKFCTFFTMISEGGDPVPEVSEGITECRWLPVDEAIRTITYDNAREVVRRVAESLAAEGIPEAP